MAHIETPKSNRHTLFLPSFIDDYGFTPEEFRVFARIMRRSLGNEKGCFESVPGMAKSFCTSERLVKRAFKVLADCNAITRVQRNGKTDVFDFNTCDNWKPSSELPQIRQNIDGEIKRKDRERKALKTPPVGAETTPLVGAETTPPVGAETPYEGISNKLLISQEGTPLKEEKKAPPPFSTFSAHFVRGKNPDTTDAETDERLRFFPFLERARFPVQTLNELVEFFSYVAGQENRRTLIKENDWVGLCDKLFAEGMSPSGMKSLYRFCKEKCGKSVITPKVMDWKFTEYKKFVEKRQGVTV